MTTSIPLKEGNTRAVMAGLRAILEPYEAHLVRTAASDSGYSLDTRYILPNKQPLFLAPSNCAKIMSVST